LSFSIFSRSFFEPALKRPQSWLGSAAFFGAAFFASAFLGSAFLGAAFLGSAFFAAAGFFSVFFAADGFFSAFYSWATRFPAREMNKRKIKYLMPPCPS